MGYDMKRKFVDNQGTQLDVGYQNVEIVEIDGVKRVVRKKDKEVMRAKLTETVGRKDVTDCG